MELLLHLNGVDGSTTFTDSSGNSHSVTGVSPAQIDTAKYKFGGASLMSDTYPASIYTEASSDWNFPGDFTIDFWINLNNLGNYKGLFQSLNPSNGKFQLLLNSSNEIYFFAEYGSVYILSSGVTWNTDQWYHIALVRSGSSIKIYQDGFEVASGTYSYSLGDASYGLSFAGIYIGGTAPLYGYMDEIRISKGVALWTSNFTPPIYEYGGGPSTEYVDSSETVLLDDEWTAVVDTKFADLDEDVYLSDTWGIALTEEEVDINHTILLTDNWGISLDGIIHSPFVTKLYTTYTTIKKFLTELRTSKLVLSTFDTKLHLKTCLNEIFKTDLRIKYIPYDSISIGSLNDFVVKLDGVELVDVDYSTLNITLNLNTTPSRADFVLGRRHDNLDETLDGVTSVITNENKIEVFDGTTKLFTGYVSEIEANSGNDTVKIIAEDVRRKLSRLSMELEYGGAWQQDSNHNGIPDETDPDQSKFNFPSYIRFEKNIYTALNEVVSAIGGYISGIDSYPFAASFVPEYVKSYNDYVSLFDELIRQTATVNWYIDENERVRFQQVAQGTIKNLPLSSLNSHRHVYDLIIDDIRLNKMGNGYVKTLNVKRGKDYKNLWRRVEFGGWLDVQYADFFQTTPLTEFASFCFQAWNVGTGNMSWDYPEALYVGINQTIYGATTSGYGWTLYPMVVVQWQDNNTIDLTNVDLPDITVGSGLPKKTIYLTSYGKKQSNEQWSEELKEDATTHKKDPYLVAITDEKYDKTGFCLDLANFELAQNNKLQTNATISMILDAYKYYNLSFRDLINITNTIKVGIYKDTNGFPLNIESVSINCANRTVTMTCTNYGKSYYEKTANILNGWEPPKLRYLKIKSPVQRYSSQNL